VNTPETLSAQSSGLNAPTSRLKLRFFSIAPEFGIYDRKLDQTYHYTAYQLCLQTACRTLGHEFTVVAPKSCSIQDEGILPLLSSSPLANISTDLRRLVDEYSLERANEQVVVLLYEGTLSAANEIFRVANQYPSIKFLVNLFESEPYYEFDENLEKYAAAEKHVSESPVPDFLLPTACTNMFSNLRIVAETQTKAFAARLLGLTAVGRWQTFSAISAIRIQARERNQHRRHRVLLPLSSWQLSNGLVDFLISTKKNFDQYARQASSVEFHLTGYLSENETAPLVEQMREAGFRVSSTSRSKESYAETYSTHDVAWLPSAHYFKQSSGKALDALVQGTPIIAPIGSYAWAEQNRWVEGAPGYASELDARNLFLNLRFILPAIACELNRKNQSIRDHYSPLNTVSALIRELDLV
jgi:hypothetical protein